MAKTKSLEWGADYRGRTWSPGLSCINVGCKAFINQELNQKLLDNLELIAQGVRYCGRRDNRPYGLAAECPECFSQYYFHISEERAVEVLTKVKEIKMKEIREQHGK